jgi:hypothetical protein
MTSATDLEALRRHGFGVAYRMLGSVSEAEDVAQEALLRLARQEGPIDEPAAWMTTVSTRLSINVLKSARARRESYVGPWLPEPLVEDPIRGPHALVLEGTAGVDFISVVAPAAMRASVLGPAFFYAERHPRIAFRSTQVRLLEDGRAEVEGELTIRGITRPVAAFGHYAAPRMSGFGEVAGLQLHTSFDRREFGFDWQMELPGGDDAVG